MLTPLFNICKTLDKAIFCVI